MKTDIEKLVSDLGAACDRVEPLLTLSGRLSDAANDLLDLARTAARVLDESSRTTETTEE